MREKGIDQWDEIYPPPSMLANDIQARTLFGGFAGAELCGLMVLNETQSPEYGSIRWNYPKKPLIVHRVCTRPSYLKKGVASNLMKFAENHAIQNGYDSIRLDAFVKNTTSVAFYRKLEYVEVGRVNFRKGEFFCFEKEV